MPIWAVWTVELACSIVICAGIAFIWYIVDAHASHKGYLEAYNLGDKDVWLCLAGNVLGICWK